MHRFRRHLTYANVAATLALFIAVAGGTTAIAGGKAAKNSVASSSIKPFNVTARDLAGIRLVQVSGQVNAFAPCPGATSASSVVAAEGESRRRFKPGQQRLVCGASELAR